MKMSPAISCAFVPKNQLPYNGLFLQAYGLIKLIPVPLDIRDTWVLIMDRSVFVFSTFRNDFVISEFRVAIISSQSVLLMKNGVQKLLTYVC